MRRLLVMVEILIPIKVELLEDGGYLATSDDLYGLVAQGYTVTQRLEMALRVQW
jgi:predicted RNase H-like HicB family nuclease